MQVKDGSGDFDRESFLLFDLGAVSTSAYTRSALSIPVTALPNGAPVTLEVGLVPGFSWSETALTWANRPATFQRLAVAQVTQPGALLVNLNRAASQLGTGRFTLVLRSVAGENRMLGMKSREAGGAPALILSP